MDIQQLKYFISIAKYLNFTKAAEECFVAQTTISYQISELENELGFRLFNRDKKSVSLTVPGACFLEPAKELVRKAEYSVKLAQNVSANISEALSVGYFGHICYTRIPQWLCAVRAEHPDLFIQLYQKNQTELRRLLEKGVLDCFFSTGYGALPNLDWIESLELFSEPRVLVVNDRHWAAKRKSIRMEELKNERFFLYVDHDLFLQENHYQDYGISLSNVVEVDSHDSSMLLSQAGCGLTICARGAYSSGAEHLVAIPIENPQECDRVYLCWKKGSAKEVIRDFIRLVQADVGK